MDIYIIAGPNGAGKTTFAETFIPETHSIKQFINADLIAYGLSPFSPEREVLQAGKIMLKQINKLVSQKESFSLETTLAGKTYANKIPQWKKEGYIVHLIFLALPDEDKAVRRVAKRVKEGGHNIPEENIRRRFKLGLKNLECIYKPLADHWIVYDNWNAEQIKTSHPNFILKIEKSLIKAKIKAENK